MNSTGRFSGTLRMCGDWPATTGLAHAARRLALALLRAGVDVNIETFASGAPREPGLVPDELRARQHSSSSRITLWTLNINELHQVTDAELHAGGPGGYQIASWFWEFPTIPPWLQRQFGRVSELWAPSSFIQRAMARYSRGPISIVPPVVPVFRSPAEPVALRDSLGLPRRRLIFLASFDFNSTISRKNPFGVVEAFSRAFPKRTDAGPLLVVKAINLFRNATLAQRLQAAVGRTGGVLIDRQMTGEEFEGLFHASDVYVSLHRSEGFGLGLAEAMAIGKAVIGTGYSGNLDFMTADNSCLVGYELRALNLEDQLDNPGMAETYVRGSLWADPDIGQAAQWMQLLADCPDLRAELGMRAAQDMRESYSEGAVASVAIGRLAEIDGRLEAALPAT